MGGNCWQDDSPQVLACLTLPRQRVISPYEANRGGVAVRFAKISLSATYRDDHPDRKLHGGRGTRRRSATGRTDRPYRKVARPTCFGSGSGQLNRQRWSKAQKQTRGTDWS